ncbi:NAC domain-containing protein 74 [Platanthera guangdongensis]|uniref:NAC domain-containing protein 74 n=1 Tax=Platanthera guangdongensis TaxID=2320717 RepID=A0ABR2MPL4_9ASPA
MSLPPGFRFHPTDDELVGYYLKRKVHGEKIELEVIPVVDLYKFDPWELPVKSFLMKRDMEWFFFCPRDRKHPNGSRTNRATRSGYWKATGKDRKIVCCESSVKGLRKTLVFYRGRAPGGERTDWVMHEYRLYEDLPQETISFLGAFALCRVIKRTDQGHKGENKAKKVHNSVTAESDTKKYSSNVLSSLEANPSGMIKHLDVSKDPIHASFFNDMNFEEASMEDGLQTQYHSPHALSDASMGITPEEDTSEQMLQSQFPQYFAESCPINGISPVSSFSRLDDETFSVVRIDNNCFSSTFPSPLNSMNAYYDEETLSFQNLEWAAERCMLSRGNGITEPWNAMLSTPLCRQASSEDQNLWSQEENIMFVI